jgi:hypothetical protein
MAARCLPSGSTAANGCGPISRWASCWASWWCRATTSPWPIEPAHVALIVEGLNPILPGWVRPDRTAGLTASFQMRLSGEASHIWAFRDGRLHVNRPTPAASTYISPATSRVACGQAALLLVLYARESQRKHIATGRLTAWGRRPWLEFTLTTRFHKP